MADRFVARACPRGDKEDGTPDRRHVRAKTKAEITAKVRALERDREDSVLNNNSEDLRWKALITAAGGREARLHDGRHTATTTLLLLGVSERAVIDIMGWSSAKMTLVYQHITDGVRKNVAAKVGDFIWGASVSS